MSQNQSEQKVWVSVCTIGLIVSVFLFWWIYFKNVAETTYDFVYYLPYLNCALNALTTFFLITGYLFIRQKKVSNHKIMMIAAGCSSAVFLVSYLTYHHFVGDTKFLGQGLIRPIYFFILITHIILSIIQLPCILATFFYAFTGRFEQHKKIARITFPIWLYVSITGIIIFCLLKTFPS